MKIILQQIHRFYDHILKMEHQNFIINDYYWIETKYTSTIYTHYESKMDQNQNEYSQTEPLHNDNNELLNVQVIDYRLQREGKAGGRGWQ